MSNIKHVSVDYFESRVSFVKSEQLQTQGKVGIREYINPYICFFAVLFGFAINVSYKGKIYCLNKCSFRNWVKRNLGNDLDINENLAPLLIAQVRLPPRIKVLRKQIEQLKDAPAFVKKLSQNRITLEHYRDLKAWRRARDVLMVWKILAKSLKVDLPELKMMDSISSWLEQAKGFPVWFEGNKDKFSKIRAINFSNSQLVELPKEIWKLVNLTGLNLSYNQLKELPKEIRELKNLRYLLLSGNRLKELPKEIGELKNLESIYLAQNKLKTLPKEINQIPKLKTLSLEGNANFDFSSEILSQLKENGVKVE